MAGETSLESSSLGLEFGTLLSTTLMKVLDSGALHDQIFENDILLQWLRSGNRIKTIDGGERIRVGLMFGKNTTAKPYADYEALDVTGQAGITSAFFNWKQYSASISMHGRELRSNRGPSRITDLQKEKMMQTAMSLVDVISTGAYSDGTGSGSQQLTGLDAMIEETPGTASYGSVPTTNTAWRNKAVTSVGAAATNLLTNMRTVCNDCSQGKGGSASSPDFIVTTQAVHEALEALILPQVRYAPNPSGGADAGIESLKFKGANVVWDDYCTTGDMYILNSNHIFFFVHSAANFSMAEGGFQKPINQDALIAQILFQGNLATNNRRKLGRLNGIT